MDKDCIMSSSISMGHEEAEPPNAMQSILNLAIQNKAPVQVIRTILRINPNAAAVPPMGLSSLQLAVRCHSSMEVVKELIDACPDALNTGNGSYDPLSYAKLWRPHDKALIQLLETQSYACELEVQGIVDSATPRSSKYCPWERNVKEVSCNKDSSPVSPLSLDSDGPRSHGSKSRKSRGDKSSFLSNEDKSELTSVKWITAALVRAQKRHQAEMAQFREYVEEEIHALRSGEAQCRIENEQWTKAQIDSFEKNVGLFCKLVAQAVDGLVERQEDLERKMELEISALPQAFRRARFVSKERSWIRRTMGSLWKKCVGSGLFPCRGTAAMQSPWSDTIPTEIRPMKDGVEVSIQEDAGRNWSPMDATTPHTWSTTSLDTNTDFSPYFYPEKEESGPVGDQIPLVEATDQPPRVRSSKRRGRFQFRWFRRGGRKQQDRKKVGKVRRRDYWSGSRVQ